MLDKNQQKYEMNTLKAANDSFNMWIKHNVITSSKLTLAYFKKNTLHQSALVSQLKMLV